MATTISPIKILSDLGLNPWEIENDEDYLRALKEGIITIEASTKGKGDKRSVILREELIRVRKGPKKTQVKEKNTRIRGDKLMGREPKKDAPPTADKPKLLPGSGKFNTDDVKPADVDKDKKKDSSGLNPDKLDGIAKTVESIALLLRRQFKLEKKQQRDSRRQQNKSIKDAREDKLESKPKDKKTGLLPKAIKKPALNFFEKLKTFFLNIAIGAGAMKLMQWLKNPENAEKITKFKDFLVNNAGLILGGLAAIALLPIAVSLVLVVKSVLAGLALLGPLLPLLPWILGGILVGAVAWWIGKKISKFITGGETIGQERKENVERLRASGIMDAKKNSLTLVDPTDGKGRMKVRLFGENSITGRDFNPLTDIGSQESEVNLDLMKPKHAEWYVKNYGQEALDEKLAAYKEFRDTKAALIDTKKDMQSEIKSERKKWKEAALAKRDATGAEKVDWEVENEAWKEKEEEIRQKYADKAIQIGDAADARVDDATDNSAVIDKNVKVNTEVSPPNTKTNGGVTVVDGGTGSTGATDGGSYSGGGGESGEEDETFSSEDPNDPSVFSSKALYNMGG
jgi:hypothetical protein